MIIKEVNFWQDVIIEQSQDLANNLIKMRDIFGGKLDEIAKKAKMFSDRIFEQPFLLEKIDQLIGSIQDDSSK